MVDRGSGGGWYEGWFLLGSRQATRCLGSLCGSGRVWRRTKAVSPSGWVGGKAGRRLGSDRGRVRGSVNNPVGYGDWIRTSPFHDPSFPRGSLDPSPSSRGSVYLQHVSF